MNAEFFALAFLAGLNPKLLALDLVLLENRRPRAMFLWLIAEPRLLLAAGVGAVIGIPGASYLAALHHLVAGNYSTATQVIAVVIFVLISFLLIIIPYAFLELRPEATKAALKGGQAWLLGHAQQLIALVAMLLGAYLTISAAVRLA